MLSITSDISDLRSKSGGITELGSGRGTIETAIITKILVH